MGDSSNVAVPLGFLPFFFLNEILFIYLFWPHRAACGILVPQPGIEPMPHTVEAQSLNHWAAREVPGFPLLNDSFHHYSVLMEEAMHRILKKKKKKPFSCVTE